MVNRFAEISDQGLSSSSNFFFDVPTTFKHFDIFIFKKKINLKIKFPMYKWPGCRGIGKSKIFE
jgi:hypothetical protein